MLILSQFISQIILVTLAIGTIIFIYKTPARERADQFNNGAAALIKISVLSGIISFIILMLNVNMFSSLLILALQTTIIFAWHVTLIFPFLSYKRIFQSGSEMFNMIIFSLNIISNATIIAFFVNEFYIMGRGLSTIEILSGTVAIIMIIMGLNVFAHLLLYFYIKLGAIFSGKNKKETNRKHYSSDKTTHYQKAGLSYNDIDYLREQLSPLRDMIFELDDTMNQTAKLRSINLRNKTVITCQDYFRSIVEEPNRIGEAGNFMYKLLPNLTDLVAKYNEINGHVAKNKQTYLILDKSAQMIELVADEINEDYINFHQATYNAMDEEIAYAERILNKKNDPHLDVESSEVHQDGVDQIISELNDFIDHHE